MSDETLTKAMLLSAKETGAYFGPYLNLKAEVIYLTGDGTPRNMTSLSRWDADYGLSGFVVTALNSGDHAQYGYPAGQAFAWNFGMTGIDVIDSTQVIASAKVMTKVQRKVDALVARLGHPEDFGRYLMWVADALGITTFVIETDAPLHGTYASGEYEVISAGRAGDWLREKDKAFIAKHLKVAV